MHVLGAGALGCLWSARLALAGARPKLLLRPGSPKAALLRDGGIARLHVERPRPPEGHADGIATPDSADIAEDIVDVSTEVVGDAGLGETIRSVLVVTKAPATMRALESIAPRLVSGAVIVVLSNGALGIFEQIRASAALAKAHVVLGTTTHGAWTRGDFRVVHAGVGQTWLGSPPGSRLEPGRLQEVLGEVGAAGLGAVDEGGGVMGRLWLKLAANAVINPLTALWGVPNGAVVQSAEGERVLKEVCDEVSAVAAGLARAHPQLFGDASSPSSPPSAVVAPSSESLQDFVRAAVEATAQNRSSMLQDVSANRPTEINFLNGWVTAKGDALGVLVPTNRALAQEVRKKTADCAE